MGSFHSHRKQDLNRASIYINSDKIMAQAISEFYNVDGYISHTVPSLWHRNGIFHEEICIFNQRSCLKRTNNNIVIDVDNEFPYSNIIFKINMVS